ncbi:tRNA lysidine(34) synthetase TilS [Mesorhizobium sp. IMUNJ 23232]|uniref:tRNA lysidine(34) synthetase TilS n=1 Tax=Mesorhizobium sp. IMUNJ 23232 TaxID=3376064 RepID=UPI00379AD0B7
MQTALSPPGEPFEAISRCGFENRSAVIAAVSGGSDSTALLLLLKSFMDIAAIPVRLVAVTVDHRLRPEAADEALAVGKLAARLGVEHRTLRWVGPKPATGIASAAREARYRLLATAAEDAGTDMVLTAHTADDQAETVFMRRQRGDGMGLAGMAPVTLFDGKVWIARPILNTRRETLRDFLRENSIGWIDDPSNVDLRSERVRIRLELTGWQGAGSSIEALLHVARENAALREKLGCRAAALISRFAREAEPGLLHLDPCFLRHDDEEAAIHALRVLLAVAGGMPHLSDLQRTAALAARISEPPHRATLSRTLVASRRDGVWFCREGRALPEPGPACEGMIWDGRFRISAVGSPDEASVAPAGGTSLGKIEERHGAPKSLIRLARASQPVFLHDGENSAEMRSLTADLTSRWNATPVPSLHARFLPSFDIDLARAISALIGAPPIPDPPCAGHNVGRA